MLDASTHSKNNSSHEVVSWKILPFRNDQVTLLDGVFKQEADDLVVTFADCQKKIGNGYLSAFPESWFDRLRAGTPVWAPFYTLHKIIAGHLDMYTHTGNEQALKTVEGIGDWVGRWAGPLSDEDMQRILEVEQGGCWKCSATSRQLQARKGTCRPCPGSTITRCLIHLPNTGMN